MKSILFGILAVIILAGNAFGVIAVNKETANGTDGSTMTISGHTSGGENRFLGVAIATADGATITDVTYNSVSLTEMFENIHSGASKPLIAVWYMVAPTTSGDDDIDITISTANKMAASAITWTGVSQHNPFTGVTDNEGLSTGPTDDVASLLGHLVVDAMASIAGGAPTVHGSQNEESVDEMGGGGASDKWMAQSSEDGINGNVTMSWTIDESKEWVTIGYSLNPGGNVAGSTEFRTNKDSANATIPWIIDGDPRQGSATQARGNLSSMQMGNTSAGTDKRYMIIQDSLVRRGTTQEDGLGIPTGQEILACTLWVHVIAQPTSVTDTTVFDLRQVDDVWNEVETNVVSWNNRQATDVLWNVAGVLGTSSTLKLADAFAFERIDAFSFHYYLDSAGQLVRWDSVIISEGDSIPIPIPLATAQCIYAGTCEGIVTPWVRAAAELAFYTFASSEGSTPANRPEFQWIYKAAAGTGFLGRRRR